MNVIDIIAGTPIWVWLVLAFLIYRGVMAARPRQTGLHGPLLMPVIMFAVSMSSAHAMRLGAPQLAWIAALAAGGLSGAALAARMALDVEPGPPATLHLPGSWISLVLILSIFLVSYVFGVIGAIDPALAAASATVFVHAVLRGIFSGIFLGRGLTLFLRARAMLRAVGAAEAQ
jgi:hypothetical protein